MKKLIQPFILIILSLMVWQKAKSQEKKPVLASQGYIRLGSYKPVTNQKDSIDNSILLSVVDFLKTKSINPYDYCINPSSIESEGDTIRIWLLHIEGLKRMQEFEAAKTKKQKKNFYRKYGFECGNPDLFGEFVHNKKRIFIYSMPF